MTVHPFELTQPLRGQLPSDPALAYAPANTFASRLSQQQAAAITFTLPPEMRAGEND